MRPSQLSGAIRTVLGDTLDEFQQDLRELMTAPEARPVSPPAATASDLKDVAAYRAWSRSVFGYAPPEGELLATRNIEPGGSLGAGRSSPVINRMIQAGGQRLTSIPVPTERQAAWVERHVAGARVVRLRNAHHYLFITHASEVQQEIAAFVRGLR